MAAYVRAIIDRELGETGPHADVAVILDLGDSGGSDVARHKDAYLGEAVETLHPPR